MAAPTKAATPLAAAIKAATEFKLLLDVQPAGALYNPGGKGDARTSATYALASQLLAEATSERLHGAERPGMMHSGVMSIVDVVADHRANMPADLLELLTGVAVILGKLGFQIPDQNSRSGEHGGSFKVSSSTASDGDVMVQKVKGQLDAVHGAVSEKVVGRTLCHEQVDLLMDAAFGPGRAREKRSAAYMEGARSYLEFRATGAELICQYTAGTTEFDAYFAGLDEGREMWRSQMRKEPARLPPLSAMPSSAAPPTP